MLHNSYRRWNATVTNRSRKETKGFITLSGEEAVWVETPSTNQQERGRLLERNAISTPLRIHVHKVFFSFTVVALTRLSLRHAAVRTEVNNHRVTQHKSNSMKPQQNRHGQGCYSSPRTRIWSWSCALLTLFTLDTYTERRKWKTTTTTRKKEKNMPFLHSKAILCISVGCTYQM